MSYVFIGYTNNPFSRTKNYYESLNKQGYIVEWIEVPPGFAGLLACFRERQKLLSAEEVIVTSPSNLVVILVFLSTLRRAFYDAGWPVLDGVSSRTLSPLKRLTGIKHYTFDFLSFQLSKKVFLETPEQVSRVRTYFFCKKSKLSVLYTGFNQSRMSAYHLESDTGNRYRLPIKVLFRGGPQPESGIDLFLETVKFFKSDSRFHFQIVGPSPKISDPLRNLDLLGRDISENELFRVIADCHIMIGQLGANKRLEWTIPNRFFEAAYFKKPYFSLQRGTMFQFGERGMVATVDCRSVEKIVHLLLDYSSNPKHYAEMAHNLNVWYLSFASSDVLGLRLLTELH